MPGPDGIIRNDASDNFTVKSLEMESKYIKGLTNFTGKFQWRVLLKGETEIAGAWNEISALTGNIERGGMVATEHFSPFVLDDAIITYGFYDSGHGEAGLTNRHQCYVTICSRSNESWMGAVAPPESAQAQLPFARFVLPAAHDNGMNTMENARAVLKGISPSHNPLMKEYLPHLTFFDHLPDAAIAQMLPNIVYATSVTQKKPIRTMLDLGTRYFEFRPALLLPLFQEISSLPNKFYFQHSCIPGVPLESFLDDQVAFLDEHPTEIVTLHFRFDNIPAACKKPTKDEIADHLNNACAKANKNGPLTWCGREDFITPIDDLRRSGKRLIVVTLAEKYDSWTAQAYATLHTESIIGRFESMNTEGQHATDLTVLQCQATSQSIPEVLVHSVVASNTATSCLSSTKAMGDMRTLPWIRANANQRLKAERNIVVMNDFIDGATCDTCVDLSAERLSWGPADCVR